MHYICVCVCVFCISHIIFKQISFKKHVLYSFGRIFIGFSLKSLYKLEKTNAPARANQEISLKRKVRRKKKYKFFFFHHPKGHQCDIYKRFAFIHKYHTIVSTYHQHSTRLIMQTSLKYYMVEEMIIFKYTREKWKKKNLLTTYLIYVVVCLCLCVCV